MDLCVYCLWKFMSFSSHFLFLVLVYKSYKKQKYYEMVCLFFIIFHFHLACLALQTKNIGQKITQAIFIFGNFVNQNKKQKMGWKAHKSQILFHTNRSPWDLYTVTLFNGAIDWKNINCTAIESFFQELALTSMRWGERQ